MKAVLISIRPKWVEKIVSGEKTLEVRKTRPKLETPFKCYIYCTEAKKRLVTILKDGDENYGEIHHGKPVFIKVEEGSVCDMWGKRQKIVGEFTCDRIDEYDDDTIFSFRYEDYARWNDFDLDRACMHPEDFQNYANGKWLYGWHISDLKIYDQPKELSEFCFPPELYCEKGLCGRCPYDQSPNEYGEYSFDCEWKRPITRPPQSWCYVKG